MPSMGFPWLEHGYWPANRIVWSSGRFVTSPLRLRLVMSTPSCRTSRFSFTYGMSRTTRFAPSMPTLNPSSRSRRRSSLRSISLCDIEDRPALLDGHAASGSEGALVGLALGVLECHGEHDVWIDRMPR